MGSGWPSEPETRLFANAFALRRVWTAMDTPFNKSDILVLGLLVQLTDRRTIVIGDQNLRSVLIQAFKCVPCFADVAITSEDASGCNAIELIGSPDALGTRTISDFCLLYGLRSGLSLSTFDSDARGEGRRLWLFGCFAPALWQSTFAAVNAEPQAPAYVNDLATFLQSEWLDPLKLYEDAIARHAEHGASDSQPSHPDAQIARLQARVQELEQVGLVRHELEAARAAARVGHFD